MSRLNIFIDGTWLFKVCRPNGVLSLKTENPWSAFHFDFSKLNRTLLDYVKSHEPRCENIGELNFVTSIFNTPTDVEHWHEENEELSEDDVKRFVSTFPTRERFASSALSAGYDPKVIYRPMLKPWHIVNLIKGRFQEKQVDATVVALLVRSAIVNSNDYHVVITGDADMLPAIKVAYPEYSKNVFVATTHPDELKAEHRQTSWSLANFSFNIPAFFLQDHVEELHEGLHVYECTHCRAIFSRPSPIPVGARPCCAPCFRKKD